MKVHGICDAGFSLVKQVFHEQLESGRELGAGFSATLEGLPIIDIWGGYADPGRTRPWQQDTLVCVFSVTKAMAATCVLHLIDRGLLDLDQKISTWWPEFGQKGKEEITLRLLLSHRAGLPAITRPLPPEALFDWKVMTRALAEQEPLWPPGTQHGYHARTFGWLVGEVVRRIAGKSLGVYFRDEIAGPLGLDFHIGLDDAQHGRAAWMTASPESTSEVKPNFLKILLAQPESLAAKAFHNPPGLPLPETANTAQWRRAELPSSNGFGTAESIALFYGALACGGAIGSKTLLSAETVERARVEQSRGIDAVLRVETRFGLGFTLPFPGATLGPNPLAFGHPGIGGALGFADPAARLGVGYVTNLSGPATFIDKRAAALVDALYASLG